GQVRHLGGSDLLRLALRPGEPGADAREGAGLQLAGAHFHRGLELRGPLLGVSQAKEPALQDRGLNGTAVEEPEVRPCKEVAPGLLAAIRAYASFNLLYSLFILIGVAGLSQILYCLARRGLIRV
ncbi:unnamed protein product, partial [Effrenium voratum]